MRKAPSAGQKSGVKRLCEKMRPAKTKRFLLHWRGRNETKAAATRLTTRRPRPVRSSDANHVAELSEAPGGVAGIHHERRLADQALRVELGVRGQEQDQVVGVELGLLPGHALEQVAPYL